MIVKASDLSGAFFIPESHVKEIIYYLRCEFRFRAGEFLPTRLKIIYKRENVMSKDLLINYDNKPCYNIHIRSDFNDFVELFQSTITKEYDAICIVTDTNVAPLYLDTVVELSNKICDKISSFTFKAGEESKNLNTVQNLYEHLIKERFTRKSLLIALGGGVVGDLTGFTASTYLRGIDFIQMPTTLLSQVDSSVGGKTGVDFLQYKNMVGAFYMPKMVYMNLSTLNTLNDYNFACGMSEVIKSALIQNADFYCWLKSNSEAVKNKDFSALEHTVYECCKIKGYVVEIDPKEQGIRAYLNFGHTIGHAVEKLSNFAMGHGQCVSTGMVSAAHLSKQLGYLNTNDVEDITNTLLQYDLPISVANLDANDILMATKSDKKMSKNKIKFTILKNIGEADSYLDFTDDDLINAIKLILE